MRIEDFYDELDKSNFYLGMVIVECFYIIVYCYIS